MEQTEQERRFETEMRDGLSKLKRLGYNSTYFICMMNEMGQRGPSAPSSTATTSPRALPVCGKWPG